jgi:hypothetical protein
MNDFTRAIKAAKERGENSLAARIDAERRICSAIVKYALANEILVSVCDGEEWTVKKSDKYKTIMDALFSTDEDILQLRSKTGENLGRFILIYGNDGFDVVSDYTITETTEKVWNEVIKPLSDKIESGM